MLGTMLTTNVSLKLGIGNRIPSDSEPNTVNPSNASKMLLAGYPATPEGQESFVRDLVSDVSAIPGNHGFGVFYWEPAWLPGVGWEPGAGTGQDNLTEFDFKGNDLPAIDAFQIGALRSK
jgi:arabinogalactan endo-1,4-beta-galactosidase